MNRKINKKKKTTEDETPARQMKDKSENRCL